MKHVLGPSSGNAPIRPTRIIWRSLIMKRKIKQRVERRKTGRMGDGEKGRRGEGEKGRRGDKRDRRQGQETGDGRQEAENPKRSTVARVVSPSSRDCGRSNSISSRFS